MPAITHPERRRHYFEVALDAGGGVIFTGKGPTEAAARVAAKKLAKKRGGLSASAVNALAELEVKSLVGPKPRTFTGNTSTP